MASKTISIDREAYEILKSHKFGNESFSDVIKKQILVPAHRDHLRGLRAYFGRQATTRKGKHGTTRGR